MSSISQLIFEFFSRCRLNMEDENVSNIQDMQYGTAYILYITHSVTLFFLANMVSLYNSQRNPDFIG